MLTLPINSPDIATIVGIDPGSTNMGVSVITINLVTLKIVSSIAWTINGAKLSDDESWIAQLHGDRYSRIKALEETLLQIFNYYQPIAICAESAFINGRFPAAVMALVEVMGAIRSAVTRYDVWKVVNLVPPSSAKTAVSAGGAANKDTMKEKVMQVTELNYSGTVPLELLDEHSIDSLAIGYYMYKKLLRGD